MRLRHFGVAVLAGMLVLVGAAAEARGIGDPRPSRWCGWWMRQHLGVADKAFNLARNWARYGTNAHGPGVGVVVVWRHHVGIITGRGDSGWIVKSGNDGKAVRERERSLRGVIAYRHPSNFASNDHDLAASRLINR